jgi:hypothetical protein
MECTEGCPRCCNTPDPPGWFGGRQIIPSVSSKPYAPTRRDYFAAAALTGAVASNALTDAQSVDYALHLADALITALDGVKP